MVLIGVFAVMFGTPRVLTDDGRWPDVLAMLDGIAADWQARPRWLDVIVAVVAVVLLGLGVSVFRGGALLEASVAVGWVLLLLGFVGLFAATHVNVRRSGLSSAEATFIGATLVGVVLLVAITAILVAF